VPSSSEESWCVFGQVVVTQAVWQEYTCIEMTSEVYKVTEILKCWGAMYSKFVGLWSEKRKSQTIGCVVECKLRDLFTAKYIWLTTYHNRCPSLYLYHYVREGFLMLQHVSCKLDSSNYIHCAKALFQLKTGTWMQKENIDFRPKWHRKVVIDYHSQMQLSNMFRYVCRCVCLSCLGSNFWERWPRNFVFGVQVHLWDI